MNILNRKLHLLEKNVLPELPEEGTTRITWDNGDTELNEAENELHRHATQILQYHANELQAAKERGDTTYNPLSTEDQALVDAANRRFMARILEIFQTFTDAFVTYKDPMANWVFYTRFYWLIEETRKFKEQYDAEEEVFNTLGYWELCEGEQERRLAPVYAAWNHDLFTPESFNRYCERHHVFKATEDIEQFIANRTPEQARQDELEEQQEQAENAETDARNARYLKEKCPTCAERCNWFKKISQNDQICQLPITESLKMSVLSRESVENEKETPIPMLERVKISELKFDQDNPNRMSLVQLDRLKASIKRWGDIVPVVTNSELLVADGAQRVTAMKELGMTECSVIRLPIKDVDRRLLRQVLNKLRGKHNQELDSAEYLRIVELGEKEDLKALLESVGEKLPLEVDDRDISFSIPGTYEIIVECKDEADQKAKYEKLKLEGYRLRILTL